MCGLAGKLWFDPARPADLAAVRALTDAIAHRGPDGDGFAADGPCALGHRRLAILDLDARANQPMRDAAGGLLVANNEIWNWRELRAELESLGHRFTTTSDTEVVLPAYRQWWASEGPRFVSRLDGMYAFALWDGAARRQIGRASCRERGEVWVVAGGLKKRRGRVSVRAGRQRRDEGRL